MGFLQNSAKFLGIDKFGKGIATTIRGTGTMQDSKSEIQKDIEAQQAGDAAVQKLVYAAKQEQNPQRKAQLLNLIKEVTKDKGYTNVDQIDPGINLTNKEILGSAANVALNVAMPGAFKGSKTAIIAKNAALGAGFGAASGLEKNRSNWDVVGSTVGGSVIGAATGGVGLLAKGLKNYVGNTVPEWMMNKAVKPALNDLRKSVKYGSDTLGKQLLNEGVKGGPKKLLQVANDNIQKFEGELQGVLEKHKDITITRDTVWPFLRDMVERKGKVPGGRNDLIRIKEIYNELPEKMSLPQANEIKRAIYQELRDPGYKLDASLSTKGETIKNIAKGLRAAIETETKNAGSGDIVNTLNKKLSIYGKLENSMVDQLARDLRNNGIGLTDAILASGGWPTSFLALLRHAGKGTSTYAAQALHKVDKLGTGLAGRAFKNTLKRTVLSAP